MRQAINRCGDRCGDRRGGIRRRLLANPRDMSVGPHQNRGFGTKAPNVPKKRARRAIRFRDTGIRPKIAAGASQQNKFIGANKPQSRDHTSPVSQPDVRQPIPRHQPARHIANHILDRKVSCIIIKDGRAPIAIA